MSMSTSSQLPLLPSARKKLGTKSGLDEKIDVVRESLDDIALHHEINTHSKDHTSQTQLETNNNQDNIRIGIHVDSPSLEELNSQYEIDRKARTECIEHMIKSKVGSSSLSLSNPTQCSQLQQQQQQQQRLPPSKAVPPILDFVQTTVDFMNRISVEANDKLMNCSDRMDRMERELQMINDRLDSVQIQDQPHVSEE